MELDVQSQCSDEGVELSVAEYGGSFSGDFMYNNQETQPDFLEAKVLYLLLPENIPVSRAARLQWLLDHLNMTIMVPSLRNFDKSDTLEVISAIPREQNLTVKCNRFMITYQTELKFIAHSYRFVYCLDMSPSQSNVDVYKGEVLFDEVLRCFKNSIDGLSKQFTVPGNSLVFQPCIYVTIMVNTPFFITPAQQVILQGIQMTSKNVQEIIKCVETHFFMLEGKIAEVCASALTEIDRSRAIYEGIVGDLFDIPDSRKMPKIPMVTPDTNFVNMLRYSMLAISLLPDNTLSHILVITDGIVAMPDSNVMETLLFQLHYDAISVSFLKLGYTFHPNSSAGFVSYIDLLYFFSKTTLGACLEYFPKVVHQQSLPMNLYQEIFLVWSFHNKKYAILKDCDMNPGNDSFYSRKLPPLLSKRQTEESTTSSILLLLARRMREGFTVDNIFYMNNNLEIKLLLQWKAAIFIQYNLSSTWPAHKNLTRYEVHVSAPYEFLHDMTCMMRKEIKLTYRALITQRFWSRLCQLSSGDLNLATQLSNFQVNKDWFTVPESVKSGVPVFITNNATFSDVTRLTLTPRDASSPKFANMWQGVCQMETSNWRKWFHVHKISLILRHDVPLPKHLHMANSSQRYQVVQCRQAITALYGVLGTWASFVLIDNHTYLKLLHVDSDKPPFGFCIVRVSSKFPFAVLNLGFSTNTSGHVRQNVCDGLKSVLASLSYLPSSHKAKGVPCCVILQKPLEKILIRYERIPSNYTTVIFPDGTQPPQSQNDFPSPVRGSLFTTLSRYLFHKRWIWSATYYQNSKLPDVSISRILNILTRSRLKEGYSFAHSSSGIVTMVLELKLEPNASLIVQYVLFPPHCALGDDYYSESEEEFDSQTDRPTEVGDEMQMITEVWIEPHHGQVVPNHSRNSYVDKRNYYQIAEAIGRVDFQCINVLLTMEHMSLLCQNKESTLSGNDKTKVSTIRRDFSRKTGKTRFLDSEENLEEKSPWYPIITPRIEHIPFKFNPIRVLPVCPQTELLFSMLKPEKSVLKDCKPDKANKILLDNIFEHFGLLHDQELDLTKDDSKQFTREVLARHKHKFPHTCPIDRNVNVASNMQWKCFLRGVSVTHVILTFIPASVDDLRTLLGCESHIPVFFDSESFDRASSRGSNFSDVPLNMSKSISLPVYVYDCPLKLLVNSYVEEEPAFPLEDLYEDYRFKTTSVIHEDCVRLKSCDTNDNSGEDNIIEPIDVRNVKEHCKALVLTHSKCFTLSLFAALHIGVFIHNSDVQSAMDLCDEEIVEIDITNYISNICAHLKQNKEESIPISKLNEAYPCSEFKSLHMLIKDKFYKIVSSSFRRIPSNGEFYYFKQLLNKPDETINDSDDDISLSSSNIEFRSERDLSIFSEGPHLLQGLEISFDELPEKMSEISPLFLHLICTLRYNVGGNSNTSIRVIPTCLGELIQNLGSGVESLDRKSLHVTLDILCLTLPPGIQNIITEYSTQSLRTTSFCSDGVHRSISTTSDVSYNSEYPEPEPPTNLTEFQKKSIDDLCDEIKWLLKDEICATLLDCENVDKDTFNFVTKHVADGHPHRISCRLDQINLNFVYPNCQSHEKFLDEFQKMDLPLGYTLVQKGDYYYFTKDPNFVEMTFLTSSPLPLSFTNEFSMEITELFTSTLKLNTSSLKEDNLSQQSDITSDNGSVVGTDGGYDEDVSEDDDNYDWLINLSNKRPHLPNFWLIMRVEQEVVTVYFHCRFLELPVSLVDRYLEVEQSVCDSIRDLCKRVNQLLLLQSLYETKICDLVLEPDDSNSHQESGSLSRNPSFNKLKHQDDSSDDSDLAVCPSSMSEASNFKPGYFGCPMVWEKHLVLHPRLKSGSGGKTGTSRGILALKNILDKFSVSNRHNMFVYRDKEGNVFYLRLFENVNIIPRGMSIRGVDSDSVLVSRSPSINSLPLGHKPSLTLSDQSIVSLISSEVRPRVRSFGERESRSFIEKGKDRNNENTLILRVHGVAAAGNDVQCDLVQVLQNRLDDAVLDFLSVMLARNAMCPLAPEDVHFIQKPFKHAEHIIRLTVQNFALQWLKANPFIHYLKQNLLQFLNVPKYTDNRSEYHFKDYSDGDTCLSNDDNIFIYNQSQTSAGARGIACIALALKRCDDSKSYDLDAIFENVFRKKEYDMSVYSDILEGDSELPDNYLEFRLWKQGRVNIDNLSKKLKSAVSQSIWDIVTEYYLLRKPLCVEDFKTGFPTQKTKFKMDNRESYQEIEFKCSIDLNIEKNNIRPSVRTSQRLRVDGRFFPSKKYRKVNPSLKASRVLSLDNEHDNSIENVPENNVLSIVYSKYLPSWLEFGYQINTPSVKKHKINLINRHLPCLVVKELVKMLEDQPKAFPAVPSSCLTSQNEDVYIPFNLSNFIQKYVIISRGFQKNLLHYDEEHDIPAHLDCKNLKHSQKFVPIVVNNVFVPRQKIFWISVENDAIVIFTYNWAKDNIDKLITNCINLSQWLCVRSCFLNSATSQKLGLFHNQPLTRKCFMLATNSYYSLIGNLEAMSKFPRDHLHKKSYQPSFTLVTILEAFRDSFCATKYSSFDAVIVFTIEMRDMKTLEKKYRDEMKKLHSMYQSRTGTTSVHQLNLLMQNSRILHYCHTPLLFLPRWRIKCASTRDHSLYPSLAIDLADRLADKEKEIWHTDLCYAFYCEYRNYLHTLGFTPLQIDCPQGPVGVWTKDKSAYDSIFYIQRTILGGIIIFTASFNEPFFVTKMYAIECNRLQNMSSRTSLNGFTLSFLDECDKVKILMHLHSFTYDYHLRSLSNYITGNPGKLCEKYNVYQFLDHFLKYYNKAPNFARNLVHTDSLTVENLLTEGKQLYDFLLQNVNQYGFSVLEIEEGGSDFVLIKTSTSHRVSYKDSQDRECIDDFHVTLVVYNVCNPFKSTDNMLHLIYYLILTSKRETFPTYEIENKLGKFRTVSCSFTSSAALEKATDELENSLAKSEIIKDDISEQSISLEDSSDAQSSKSTSEEQTVVDVLPTVPIYQESVNYLGYYSSHEQLMQQVILEKAKVTQSEIREMVSTGMIHCRTNLLWDRLTSNNSSLTYDEFIELKNLSNLKHLGNLYPNLGSLLNQTLHWYQGLAKLLLVKYAEYNRQFTSADGNIVHYAILHKSYYGAFMLLSLDCHTSRGDLYIVYREPKKIDDVDKLDYFYQKTLCDGFVNCICFYLWSGMISS